MSDDVVKIGETKKTESRCTGHCCKAFGIGDSTYENLKLEYLMWLRGAQNSERDIANMRSGFSSAESDLMSERGLRVKGAGIHLVFPMLIPLGKMRQSPFALINPSNLPEEHPGIDMYTCKHLSSDGSCSIYDVRPLMCRKYGMGTTCEYVECTWEGHKERARPKYTGSITSGDELCEKASEESQIEVLQKALEQVSKREQPATSVVLGARAGDIGEI